MAAVNCPQKSDPQGLHQIEAVESLHLVRSEERLDEKCCDQVAKSNTDPTNGSGASDELLRPVAYGETADQVEFHMVTLMVSMALAFPPPSPENARVLQELVKKGKKTLDAPKPCYFFRCEYTLIPGTDSTVTDIVTYPVGAKVFTDNDAKVVRTWDDGNMTWVTWQEEHELLVTEEMAHQLHQHKVHVTVMNGKDKVSQRAKNDKPKAFRIPGSSDSESVKEAVDKISSTWLLSQPHSSKSDLTGSVISEEDSINFSDGEDEHASPTRFRSSLRRLAGIKKKTKNKQKLREDELSKMEKIKFDQLQKESEKIEKGLKSVHDSTKGKNNKKGTTSTTGEVEKFGEINIDLRLEPLFAGETEITSRLHEPFRPMVDSFIHVRLDKKLLPKAIEKKLNPMVLTIKSVRNLPDTPVSYEKLEEECNPVYCKYNFMNTEQIVTSSAPHDRDVYFHDIRVFFLGDYDETDLRQYIQENQFNIQVHDRDQKVKSEHSNKPPALFGDEYFDLKEEGTSTQNSHKKSTKVKETDKQVEEDNDIFSNLPELNYFSYYGIANVPLFDILNGQTNIYYEASVLASQSPEFSGKLMREIQREKKLLNEGISLQNTRDSLKLSALNQQLALLPLPPGNYITNETTLKVHIKLSQPIRHVSTLSIHEKGPFTRLIFCFSYTNKNLLKQIDDFVLTTNAHALEIDHFENHVMEAALATYKLTREQKSSKDLDMLTGFHIIDGEYHIFVLEGLLAGAITRLLEEVPRVKSSDEEFLMELYDTNITFNERKYAELDMNLSRVRLYQPLSLIVKQGLIYIRDIIPKSCLQIILNLHQMTQTRRFRDVIMSQLLPTCEMIFILNRELGVAITFKDFEEHHQPKTQLDQDGEEKEEKQRKPILKKTKMELDQNNESYEEILKERKNSGDLLKADHVNRNITSVRRLSQENREKRRSGEPTHVRANVVAFNYSTQAKNSTILSKQVLSKYLHDVDPKARFTYSEKFQSATVEPYKPDLRDPKEEKSKLKKRLGFVCSGKLNDKYKAVSEARKADLNLPFRDNLLHTSMLQSPLEWRDTNEWNDDKEMKRYLKKIKYFSKTNIESIFGVSTPDIQQQMKEREEWRKKVIVDNTRMYFHRVPAKYEKSQISNQCDRLKSLLKDQPSKLSLKKIPAPNLPPIYVLHKQPSFIGHRVSHCPVSQDSDLCRKSQQEIIQKQQKQNRVSLPRMMVNNS